MTVVHLTLPGVYATQRGLRFCLLWSTCTSYLLFSDILQPLLQSDLRWRSL